MNHTNELIKKKTEFQTIQNNIPVMLQPLQLSNMMKLTNIKMFVLYNTATQNRF